MCVMSPTIFIYSTPMLFLTGNINSGHSFFKSISNMKLTGTGVLWCQTFLVSLHVFVDIIGYDLNKQAYDTHINLF